MPTGSPLLSMQQTATTPVGNDANARRRVFVTDSSVVPCGIDTDPPIELISQICLDALRARQANGATLLIATHRPEFAHALAADTLALAP